MHVLRILQQRLRHACPQIHVKRLTALLTCVVGAVRGQRLTLTELGRALPSQARVKHSIKRVDRLLGNVQLGNERFGIYQVIARWLLTGTQPTGAGNCCGPPYRSAAERLRSMRKRAGCTISQTRGCIAHFCLPSA